MLITAITPRPGEPIATSGSVPGSMSRRSLKGVTVRLLPLDRIIASKRAANRPKDQVVIPALEEALAAIEDSET